MEKEKKKINKKKPTTTKKTTKKVVKKKTTTKKKNKGLAFTLIELLAVIIILGVLMLVAIPSVTNYINNSRKSAYVNTAKQYIKGATQLVNSGQLDVYDTGVTYYIPSTCISLETGGESPYGGKFSPAYILVTYDNDSYNYYWMSRDDNSIGVKKPILGNNLTEKLIESGVKDNEVTPTVGIDGRRKIIVFSDDCNNSNNPVPSETNINGETGEEIRGLIYPEGKDIDTVVTGDVVEVKQEEFYVLYNTSDELVLFAKYALNIGYNKESLGNVGLQHPDSKGVKFCTTKYWDGKIGTVYPGTEGSVGINRTNAYIYDSNSIPYQYVEEYKSYLISQGVPVKTARLITVGEALDAPIEIVESTRNNAYWFGNVAAGGGGVEDLTPYVWSRAYSYFGRSIATSAQNVRPVIVVEK